MPKYVITMALMCSIASAGCFEGFNTTPTNPNPAVQMFGGTWVSATANSGALLGACANFHWTVTDQSGSSETAQFSATCFGALQVSGTAVETLSGSNLNWTATGTANGGGLTNCAVNLSGSAVFVGTQIQLPYSGTTCLGPVSGTEILKRAGT